MDPESARRSCGLQIRFPVLLTPQEKDIASTVVKSFKQKVCGFDLLRTDNGQSFVCDVNGWSFVKNSNKYYDDAARILRYLIFKVRCCCINHVCVRLHSAPASLVSIDR